MQHTQPEADSLRVGLQEALRRSLSKLWVDSNRDAQLARYRDWFDHWDRRLASNAAIAFPSASEMRECAKLIAGGQGDVVKIVLPVLPKVALEGRVLGARWYENVFHRAPEEEIPYELGALIERRLASYLEPEVTRVLSDDSRA